MRALVPEQLRNAPRAAPANVPVERFENNRQVAYVAVTAPPSGFPQR